VPSNPVNQFQLNPHICTVNHSRPPRISHHLALNILVGSAILLLAGHSLVREGMFLDGLIYSSTARNLAVGDGSWWSLQYASQPFHEQPPMGIWIQSILYSLAGNSIWIEKLYCFIILLVTGLVLRSLWITLWPSSGGRTFWLPMAMWISIPLVSWSLHANLLDSLMSLFSMTSVLVMLRNPNHRLWPTMLAALCIIFAILTKGAVGLYPLAFPLISWLCSRDTFRSAAKTTLILTAVISVSVFLLYLFEPSRNYFSKYFSGHFIPSVSGERHEVFSPLGRYFILWVLASQLSIPVLPVVLLRMWYRKRSLFSSHDQSTLRMLFWLGLSASLPIMATPHQRDFYLIASFPWFALWAGACIFCITRNWREISFFKKINLTSVFALPVAIGSIIILVSMAGGIGRDKNWLRTFINWSCSYLRGPGSDTVKLSMPTGDCMHIWRGISIPDLFTGVRSRSIIIYAPFKIRRNLKVWNRTGGKDYRGIGACFCHIPIEEVSQAPVLAYHY
jgi:4-amino-4-deoxy-L-arabinose transferase-like glycosyltransferase